MEKKIFLAIFIVFVMFPALIPNSIFPEPIFLSLLSLIFLVLGIFHWKTRAYKITLFSPVSLSLLFFYGWGAMGYFYTGSLDSSYAPIVQYWGVIFIFLGLTLYIKDETDLHSFLWVGLLCAAVHSISVALQVIPTQWSLELETTDTITHFRNRNIFSSYILFFPPIALFLRSYSSSRLTKFIADLLFVLIMVIFWLAGSKGGEGAIIVELLIISVYFLYKNDRQGLKSLVVLVLASTILYHSAILFSKNNSINLKPESFSRPIAEAMAPGRSLAQRIYYWQGTWAIIKDHWLTGTGPATYSLLAPLYLAMFEDPVNAINGSSMDPSHAHNLYLQFAAELGVIGIGLFFLLIYFIYSKSYCLFRDNNSPRNDLNFFMVVSITGYLLHGIFEYNWGYAEYLYTFTILVFIVDFSIRKNSPDISEPKRLFLQGFPVFLYVLILIGGTVISKYFFYLKAIKSTNISANQTSVVLVKNITRAKEFCTNCGEPSLVLGNSFLQQYYSTHSFSFLKSSHHEFETALKKKPFRLEVFTISNSNLYSSRKF
ncbi:O-antigen ligase family protein [Nitrospinae bacterium]|nr:O-antigen ligase family protein [Nitrospinota bacterium]